MKANMIVPLFLSLATLAGCQTAPAAKTVPGKMSDACGASKYQNLVGGPSLAVNGLNIPGDSRHYGSEEPVATDTPTRLNFVHSGTAVEAVTNPKSKVIRVFCG